MNISFEGINQKAVTFFGESDIVKGQLVKISKNMTVGECSDGEVFAGIAVNNVCDGAVAVVIHGYVTVPYSGSAPSLGYTYVKANGNGGVKTAADGRTVLICDVDTVNNAVGMFI